MKTVDELKVELAKYGYMWREEFNVEYDGLTQHFSKEVDGVVFTMYARPDSSGSGWYWLMELSVLYNFYPETSGWMPYARLSIDPLFEEHIPRLSTFEAQLVKARKQLKPMS